MSFFIICFNRLHGRNYCSSIISCPLKEVIQKLVPPKGVKQKENVEGIELSDCEDKQLPLEEFEQECNDELCKDDEVVSENVEAERNSEQSAAIATPSVDKLPLPMRISVFHISPMILISKEIPNVWINFN